LVKIRNTSNPKGVLARTYIEIGTNETPLAQKIVLGVASVGSYYVRTLNEEKDNFLEM